MTTKTFIDRRERDLDKALRIDGWLTRSEAGTLYELARQSDGPIVEIGSYQGRSTAALALGSQAGNHHPVFAVDPFIGAQEGAFKTSLGNPARPCSPTLMRENLDNAGVNGLVRIVPKTSQDALADIPDECSLLFIDGSHRYEDVCRDIDLYLGRVKIGGHVMFHDVMPSDAGVVRAFDEKIMTRPHELRILGRVDTAMVVRRCKAIERSRIFLACPGRSWGWGTITQGIMQASLGAHEIRLPESCGETGWDDFNALWAAALNQMEAGEVTHWVMCHSDVVPPPGYVDVLRDELEDSGADMVSTPMALKDGRGVLSCGIGDLRNPWGAFRRLTNRELPLLPPRFDMADVARVFLAEGPGKTLQEEGNAYLLHNTGLWICDLRRPVFRETRPDGSLAAWFDFPTRVIRGEDGLWQKGRESEDWFFSRQLHKLGAKTCITRRLQADHYGLKAYSTHPDHGSFRNGDEDTAPNWRS